MPGSIRRNIWITAAAALAPGGALVLSLDLQRRSSRLWNKDQGKRVESPGEHGTLGDIIDELAVTGIAIDTMTIHRELPGAFTDYRADVLHEAS